ncbi:acyl carrier protein [Cryobacterium sp. TMS1-20-1]|uniref:acyl carrier protein n=1 Tax=Cryobacterium sp. TMS1-20-1 TaxID=1259223 RepID=UPI00106C1D84|nr:acyl carrier protein [Cryobacterium sp. TMS1-20-1]
MNNFIVKIAEILEMEPSQLSSATNFRADSLDWDSMRGFSILCMLEDDYDLSLSVNDFLECLTVEDLYSLANPSGC